ncbi:hypothetical protein ACFQVA_16825 [Actinomadura keratinilytica]
MGAAFAELGGGDAGSGADVGDPDSGEGAAERFLQGLVQGGG